MIIEKNDVELISIKSKSSEDLDNDIIFASMSNNNNNKSSIDLRNYNKNQFSDNNNDNDDDEEDDDDNDDDYFESSVRFLEINKSPNGACGFHLTRTKWDPYPWVNGCDVLGLRITEIAKLVKSSQHQVTLLLWSTECNSKCDEENLCAAPMPRSLQRLSMVVQTVLRIIECPVCLDTITPPAMQCQNGHLLCVNCRIRAENCPVCRDRYFPRPALIAEQIQTAITSAFNLCRNEDKVRQKIFGRHNRQRQMVKTTLEAIRRKNGKEVHKSLTTTDNEVVQNSSGRHATAAVEVGEVATTINGVRASDRKVVVADIFNKHRNSRKSACNKFFTKLLNSKAYSMENLTNDHNNTSTTTANNINNSSNTDNTMITSVVQPQFFAIIQQNCSNTAREIAADTQGDGETGRGGNFEKYKHHYQISSTEEQQTPNTNQFNDFSLTNVPKNHLLTAYDEYKVENDLNINSNPCCKQVLNNKMKHFSISSNDLTQTCSTRPQNISCLLESSSTPMEVYDKTKRLRTTPVVGGAASSSVCETSYETIPRAIKIKNKTLVRCLTCQNDKNSSSITDSTNSTFSTNSSASHNSSSSTLSLNSSPNLCLTLSSSSSSSSSATSSSSAQNCQSSLSSSSSSSVST